MVPLDIIASLLKRIAHGICSPLVLVLNAANIGGTPLGVSICLAGVMRSFHELLGATGSEKSGDKN